MFHSRRAPRARGGLLSGMHPRAFALAAGALLLLLAAMRLYELDRRPVHHDEGVNGWFVLHMLEGEPFRYDPANYHGPSLFYLQLPLLWLCDLWQGEWPGMVPPARSAVTTFSLRLGAVLASLLTLAALLLAAELIGPWGALAAVLLAGLSCNFLFYARYFIHESLLVFFTLLLYLAWSRYDKRLQRRDLLLVAVAAALGFATKETFALTFGALIAAYLAAEWACHMGQRLGPLAALARVCRHLRLRYQAARRSLPAALGLAGIVWVALFSSFFANLRGLTDALRAYLPWAQEASASGHVKASSYYISELLLPYDGALVLFSVVGILAAFRTLDRHGVFLSLWAVLVLVFYSAIPYKTPWLVLNILLPMSLVAGFGFQAVVEWIQSRRTASAKHAWTVLLAAGALSALFLDLGETLRVVYSEYDRPRHPQVYMHTDRQVDRLLAAIEELARSTEGRLVRIDIVASEHWPLPFYLRDYPNARFLGSSAAMTDPAAPLVIGDVRQRKEVQRFLPPGYRRRTYALRPAVDLDLFSRYASPESGSTPEGPEARRPSSRAPRGSAPGAPSSRQS